MSVNFLQMYGNLVKISFDDGAIAFGYPTNGSLWKVGSNGERVTSLQEFGNSFKINYDDGTTQIALPTGSDIFIAQLTGGVAPSHDLVDTISPGHHITNPGGTVLSGWNWHLTNNGGRGGDDWNYSYGTPYKAPAPGTADHFDVAGVGMVVRYILDTPVVRTKAQFTADDFGPMTSIWFQHGSAAFDGHHIEGDIIGHSGDGYGAYAAHLHVHGMTDNSAVAGTTNRCCFWNFL